MKKYNAASQPITVRMAEDSDNERILVLSPRCVQSGMITMYPDRSPVFNKIHRLIDPDSYHMMACAGQRVVGLLGTLHTDMYFRDEPYRTAYFMDFKVDPDFQKGLTAYRVVKPTIEKEVSDGVRMAMATFLKNNDAPMAFTKGRVGYPASLYLGDNRVFNCIPVRNLKTDPAMPVEIPTMADIPELVDLYNRFYRNYRIAPRMTEEIFRHYVTHIEGLELDNFRIVRKEGKIRAVIAIWDEAAYRCYRVIRANLRIHLVNSLVRFISLFSKTPEPIYTRQPLRQLNLVLYAHDGSIEALSTLFRYANNQHVGGRYSLLQVQVHQEDPVNACLKGLVGVSIFSEIHVFTDTHQLAKEIQNEPGLVHLEFQNYI